MRRTNLNTLDKKVRTILAENPDTRNSDITLTLAIWERYHNARMIEDNGEKYINVRQMFNLPREDHIKRIRAKIQNEERIYLPTDFNILLARIRLSKEWREFLGYEKSWNDSQLAFVFKQKMGEAPKKKIKKMVFDPVKQTYHEEWEEAEI